MRSLPHVPGGGFCLLTLALWLLATPLAADEKREQIRALAAPAVETGAVAGLAMGWLTTPPDEQPAAEASDAPVAARYGRGRGHFLGLGRTASANSETPRIDTLFEIGSISKVFTALVLAEMAERGQLRLDDPVQKYFPDRTLPEKDGQPITLAQLATHSSGLPRMPNNFRPAQPHDPYVDYDEERLFAFLQKYEMRHTPGERYAYSNLGVGLLGVTLAHVAGKSYGELVDSIICRPLAMRDTSVDVPASEVSRLAVGHDADLEPVGNWHFAALAGAGALRSTVDDLLRFAAAELDLFEQPLASAMNETQRPRESVTLAGGGHMGLGWHLDADQHLIWHNGQTFGYHSFLAIDRRHRRAVVVLCNTASDLPDALGRRVLRLLDGEQVQPLPLRTPVTLAPELLERYVGRYRLAGGAEFDVTRQGEQLWARLSLQPSLRIYPASETEFFYRVVDAQLTFEVDDQQRVVRLVLHQNGRDQSAERVP